MPKVLRVIVVLGTRPEIIKLAPVVEKFRAYPGIEVRVVTTGQHKELAALALSGCDLVPDEELGVDTYGLDPARAISAIANSVTEALRRRPCDVVVVQGDTTSTVAGAQAGFYGGVRVAHIEAGLRSHVRSIPFPEEMNRRLVTTLADIHFAPTTETAANIPKEAGTDVFVTGNTVLDALACAVESGLPADVLARHGISEEGRLLLVTIHRRESWGEALERMGHALIDLLERFDDTHVALPLHPNPIVRASLEPILARHPRVNLIDPLGYSDFLAMLSRAHLVLTDSGGVVEEAPWFGKPVIVLRDHTDRPEGIAAGTAILGTTQREGIVTAASSVLDSADIYERMASSRNPFGDGKASERILGGLLYCFGMADAPEPFE